MSDEVMDAGTAESSTATASQADPSAGTQNTGSNGQPNEAQVPFHQHPRWQQLMGERARDRQVIADLQRQLQGIDQRTQPQPAQLPMDQQNAVAALKELLGLDPALKGLLDAPKSAQELASLKQMVQGLVGQQRNGLVQASKKEIGTAATRLGVDATKLEKAVLGFLADDPAIYQRFVGGDVAAITEVLKDIEDNVFGKLTRSATAGLAQQKLTTSKLPPRASGGLPGEPGRQQLEPGKEREFRDSMHSRAIQRVRELMTG